MTDGGYTLEELRRMHGFDRITRTSLMHFLGEEGERIEAEIMAEVEAACSDEPRNARRRRRPRNRRAGGRL